MPLASALNVALGAVGFASCAGLLVAGDSADAFLDVALDLVAHALGFTGSTRTIVLDAAFGLEVLVTSDLADAFFDITFHLVHSIAHDQTPPTSSARSVPRLPVVEARDVPPKYLLDPGDALADNFRHGQLWRRWRRSGGAGESGWNPDSARRDRRRRRCLLALQSLRSCPVRR